MRSVFVILGVLLALLFVLGLVRIHSRAEDGVLQSIIEKVETILENKWSDEFLKSHRLIEKDDEHIRFAEDFLNGALAKDTLAMKDLFAKNAVQEIGLVKIEEMLEEFIDYFRGSTFTIEVPIGPNTDMQIQDQKNWKVLKGPLEVSTDLCEYRMAIRCCAYDDTDEGNEGIWSIYIIDKTKDSDQERPYRGDLQYKTGIYFDVARIR